MCIICVDFQKQLISASEARNILSEMQSNLSDDHLVEIEEMLKKAREYDDS